MAPLVLFLFMISWVISLKLIMLSSGGWPEGGNSSLTTLGWLYNWCCVREKHRSVFPIGNIQMICPFLGAQITPGDSQGSVIGYPGCPMVPKGFPIVPRVSWPHWVVHKFPNRCTYAPNLILSLSHACFCGRRAIYMYICIHMYMYMYRRVPGVTCSVTTLQLPRIWSRMHIMHPHHV